MSDAPDLSNLDDPELDRVLRARRIARWKKAIFGTFLIMVVPVLVITFGPSLVVASAMRKLDGMQGPRLPRMPENARLIAFARPYRLPADPATSPAAAGRALHAMLNWSWTGAGVLQPFTPDSINPLLPQVADSNPTHLAPWRWSVELLPLAARGLTPAQRTFLESVSAAGQDTLFSIFARAGGADIIGARYTFAPAFAQPAGSVTLPAPHAATIWRAVLARYARAALAVSSHRFASADSAVNEILGAGLLLWDEDPEITTSVTALRLVRGSLRAHATIDSLAGDSAGARLVTGFLDSLGRSHAEDPFFARKPTVGQEFAALSTLLTRTDLPTSLEWTILRNVELGRATRFCVGLSDSADWRAWADPARAALVHTRSDSLFFDWIAHPPSRAECAVGLARDSTP